MITMITPALMQNVAWLMSAMVIATATVIVKPTVVNVMARIDAWISSVR